MKNRYDDVQAIKLTGAAGENNRGLLQMERPNLITDAEERNSAQRIIAAENQDRRRVV